MFGLGAPLVALVGTNIGAGQRERALRIALTGGALAFAMTETIGVAAAIWPTAWLGLFGHDPEMLATGTAYLRVVGPDLRLLRPRPVALLRLAGRGPAGLAAARGHAAAAHRRRRRLAGVARHRLARLGVRRAGAALVVYGVTMLAAVASGVWFRRVR